MDKTTTKKTSERSYRNLGRVGNRRKGKDFYLLCDFADKNISEEQIIKEAVNGYHKRLKIEEVQHEARS